MHHLTQAERADPPLEAVNKWDALRALSTARKLYGLSDRDLNVLQALLSFHPDTMLDATSRAPVVHPSNRAICERLNGMPCSTMRRHLAKLVGAGVLLRRDSPNGKRYARRHNGEKVAYGFDLSPLQRRFTEFRDTACHIKAEEEARRQLRETVSLMRRDLAALVTFGQDLHPDLPLWDRLSDLAALTARDLRRKLDLDALFKLQDDLTAALDDASAVLEPACESAETPETAEMSTKDAQNEHHLQKSEEEYIDKNNAAENANPPLHRPRTRRGSDQAQTPRTANAIPLSYVLQVCGEIQSYLPHPVRHWRDLTDLAQTVGPMMGISRSAWDHAVSVMGLEQASVTIAAMLERLSDIRSPGGYLRHLTGKASDGRFSCGAMIAALGRRTSPAAGV